MAGTVVASTINNDTGLFSTQNAYLGIAKAWCLFDGSASTITTSFNVSSLTKNGTGDYTLTYTTAMPSANYAIVTTGGDFSTSGRCTGGYSGATRLTTSVRLVSTNAAQSGNTDCAVYYFAALGA